MNDLSLRRRLEQIELVGVASGCGAPDPGCEAAADTLRATQMTARLRARGFRVRWAPVIRPAAAHRANSLQAVRRVCVRLARRVEGIVREGDLPVVVGGDHTCAIGTWKGVAHALQDKGPHRPSVDRRPHGCTYPANDRNGHASRHAGRVRFSATAIRSSRESRKACGWIRTACACMACAASNAAKPSCSSASACASIFMSEIAERGVERTLERSGLDGRMRGRRLRHHARSGCDRPARRAGRRHARGGRAAQRRAHCGARRTRRPSQPCRHRDRRIQPVPGPRTPRRPASLPMRSMRCSSDNRGSTPMLCRRQADAREIRFEGRQHHDVRRGRHRAAQGDGPERRAARRGARCRHPGGGRAPAPIGREAARKRRQGGQTARRGNRR